ncbi:MAG: HutD family protein [Synergistaceae bacterium]|jgi:hypothetical protein|nr:HutD family protein [Synergistaceae bacterium]
MEIEVLRRTKQVTDVWSGGTTTQLAIWPPEADYKSGDFKWRISTARVEQEESVFTSLPGFHRCLMLLKGSIRLIHENHGEVILSPFGQSGFDGSWRTVSKGKCIDFNLMLAAGYEGRIAPFQSGRVVNLFMPLTEGHGFRRITEMFYCLCPIELILFRENSVKRSLHLKNGDFVSFRSQNASASDEGRISVNAVLKGISDARICAIQSTIQENETIRDKVFLGARPVVKLLRRIVM